MFRKTFLTHKNCNYTKKVMRQNFQVNRTSCSLNRASCNLAQSLYWHLLFFKGLRTFVSGVYNKKQISQGKQAVHHIQDLQKSVI